MSTSNVYRAEVLFVATLAILLAGCGTETRQTTAEAVLLNSHGEYIGSATFEEVEGGVDMNLTASYLEPGVHAVHIHQGEVCTPPAFTTAQGHLSPEDNPHGYPGQDKSHAGDLRNIEVRPDGTVEVFRTISGLTIGSRTALAEDTSEEADPPASEEKPQGETRDPYSILGRTIILHAGADDYHSQPSGDAGERVACGVIQANTFAQVPPQ